MKRLTITQDYGGQWVVETSSGVRMVGATLESAMDKMLLRAAGLTHGSFDMPRSARYAVLQAVFDRIRDSGGGQIHEGQAGA